MSLANPSRRGFLKAGGLLLVTVNLPAPLLALAEQGATDLPLDQVDSFIAIAADGKVTAFCGHVDLGTGIRTHWRRSSPKSWTSRSSRSR